VKDIFRISTEVIMKRFVMLSLLICFFHCGCGQAEYEVKTFSYTEHCIEYADQKISILETQVQKKDPVRNGDEAVAIAKKHCLIHNADIMVEYDPFTDIYCVSFIPVFEIDGNVLSYTDSQIVHVYVNADGIALMTILIG
jgi:hypothetical protein